MNCYLLFNNRLLQCTKIFKRYYCLPVAKAAKDNLTVVLQKRNDLRLVQYAIPKPSENQVLLQMAVVGICGSDVHYWQQGYIGPFIIKKPMVIGHEGSGIVIKLGNDVKHLKIGDRVAIEPGVGCRRCEFCKTGRYNLCERMVFCATPPVDGLLTRYYIHDADFCYKLPDSVSLVEGALMEPISVAIHACRRARMFPGSKVAIFGAGPIGLSSLACARAFGASDIVITDKIQHRLDVAKKMGADQMILVNQRDTEQLLSEKITETLNGKPDICLECSSAELSIRTALRVAKSGGNVVLIGMGKTEMMMPLSDPLFREVNIMGIFRYVNTYKLAIELVAAGRIGVTPIVTHNFAMEDSLRAFEITMKDKTAIKIHIHANPKWKPSDL